MERDCEMTHDINAPLQAPPHVMKTLPVKLTTKILLLNLFAQISC